MKHTIFSLILLFISTSIFAARKEILLNENWMFRFSHQVQFKSEERVNLPHTWNSWRCPFRQTGLLSWNGQLYQNAVCKTRMER